MKLPFIDRKDEETKQKLHRAKTANDFVNVRDIKDDILYTKDNRIFIYLKIQPISLELLSPREQNAKGKEFTAQFSAIKKMYKLFAISRPVDVSFMLDNLKRVQAETTDRHRRDVLQHKIVDTSQFALSGEILENQFYAIIWEENNRKDSERELHRTANEIISHFKSCGANVSICKKSDIIKMLNQFSNPTYAHMEDDDIEEHIPFVV